jgi:cyclopropane-fatty-acyl-phospholipid synthase
MLVSALFGPVFKTGNLTVVDSSGHSRRFGDGDGPPVTMRFTDRGAELALMRNPMLEFGQLYMNGRLIIDEGSLYDLIDVAGRNIDAFESHPVWGAFQGLARYVRPLYTFNPARRARANAEHHYSLSRTLYELFLDQDMQYSCAYFRQPDNTLEQAQLDKKRHIAAKLLMDKPGLRVLDIGSGWGGLGIHLAHEHGAHVTGLTLSSEQHARSNERAQEAGVADRVGFHLRDYREETGRYDRIVSVGMFEHVGAQHYRTFFRKVRELLAPGGVCLLHSITRMEPPGGTNPWLRRYIFPGGYSPAISEVMQAVEKERLWVSDIETLRLHYAETLRHWRERFYANRETIKGLYDERFCRMWDFYLTGCEVSFRHFRQMVMQMQLTREQDDVPLTRDYIAEAEGVGEIRDTRAAE